MAIVFTYTEATNIVVVTGGTSGTPATFADFVTADRAGTATLLVATAGLSPTLALTYQIRPVDVIALLITFTVAAKTAEADHIFITGTDWRDAAQTEAIDVTAGNGTYVSTKYFRTITNIDCSDNAAGGGTQWADGTVAVTQPQWGAIWNYGNGQYLVDAIFNFGNGSTSTYFTSLKESVVLSRKFLITAAATAQMGELQGDHGVNGSRWDILMATADGHWDFLSGATSALNVYDSRIHKGGDLQKIVYLHAGNIDIRNSTFSSEWDAGGANWGAYFNFRYSWVTLNMKRSYINNVLNATFQRPPTSFEKMHLHYMSLGPKMPTTYEIIIPGLTITEATTYAEMGSGAHTMEVIDPITNIGTLAISETYGGIYQVHTVNIHVADKDGNDLSGVTVRIQDKDDNVVSYIDSSDVITTFNLTISDTSLVVGDGSNFSAGDVLKIAMEYLSVDSISVNTLTVTRDSINTYNSNGYYFVGDTIYKQSDLTTDGSGDITEQLIAYKQWEGTSETLYTYSPHKFTISKAGYETLVIDNVTVDHPIVWRLELQPLRPRVYGRSHRIQAAQFI